MKLYTEKKECCGCGACVDVCPAKAVYMVSDEEGFLYPQVNASLCIKCKRCEAVCPMKKPTEGCGECENAYFGIQAESETIRYGSSSGGMFPILAEYVFRHQGVVYGAAYDEAMKVVHKEVQNREELEAVKRTKYVQSDMRGIFRRIEVQLGEGRLVLFCGTPCQASALRLFLNKSYSNLIIADLICYGVPSPGIWEAYVQYLEKKHKGKMTAFSFRDKRNRDNGHTCSYVIDGKEYAGSLYRDIYCRMYFKNYTLRPSCYRCPFCTVERSSDITLGDFWGIEKVRPDAEDGMGTSLAILHTDKMNHVWEQTKEGLFWFECEKENILQPRLKEPTPMAAKRERFMTFYRTIPFSLFLTMFGKWESLNTWLRRFGKR